MSQQLVSLKALHTSTRRAARSLDRSREEVEGLIRDFEGSTGQNPIPVNGLTASLQTLRESRQEFNELIVQFEQAAADQADNQFEPDQKNWENLDFDSHRLINRAGQYLQQSAQPDAVPQQASSTNSGVSVASPNTPQELNDNFSRLLTLLETQQADRGRVNGGSGDNGPATRLPKLELKKFDGDQLKWNPFWDRFEVSVDKNSKLAPVDKLNYLLAQLEGDAEKMVGSLSFTNENYQIAVDLLKAKYGDQRMAIALLYKKLNGMAVVKNEMVGLSKFIAEVDSLLGSLSALGQKIDDDNFATIILSKLPQNVLVQLEMSKEVSDPWTVDLVRKKLSDYAIRVERAAKVSGVSDKGRSQDSGSTADSLQAGEAKKAKDPKGHRDQQKDGGQRSQKGSSQGSGGAPGKDRKPYCVFCTGSHWSDECHQYTTADQRHSQLKDRCSNCLKEGHRRKDCKSQKPCFYCKKVGSHHSSLCFQKFGSQKTEGAQLGGESQKADDTDSGQSDKDNGSSPGLLASDEEATLQTATARVGSVSMGQKEFQKARILFDPGANRSYCSERLARKLGLRMIDGPSLVVNRFASNKPMHMKTKVAKLSIEKLNSSISQIDICVIPQISGNIMRAPVCSQKLNSLRKKVVLADTMVAYRTSEPVELLIGNDYYLDFITGEKIELEKGLYLLGSEFGFVVSGRYRADRRDSETFSMCGFTYGSAKDLGEVVALPEANPPSGKQPELADFWSLETLGIKDEFGETKEDAEAIRDFQENLKFEDGRYSVSLPWNEKLADLQVDYKLSVDRLNSLVRRLRENGNLGGKYDEIIQDQLQKGVIEKVEPHMPKGQIVHYIPHHAVITPQKETTKVRVVYDGSAKSKKDCPSLNECLYRGPVILEDLAGLLLRFRLRKVAVIADIEKAFLQIGIHSKDRDALRFLWLKDPEKKTVDGNVQMYRFCRVLFGLNCSPALLAQTVQHHLMVTDTPVSKQIQEDLYVDNVVTGVDGAEKAQALYVEAKKIFKAASMNLREWASNSVEFAEKVPEKDRMQHKVAKVLGVTWDTTKDTLKVSSNAKNGSEAKTRRQILSALSSVFDPIGLFTPVTIAGKAILQAICQSKPDWDTELKNPGVRDWSKQAENISAIDSVQMPRHIASDGEIVLIAFCDASTTAFATAVYLRNEKDGRVSVNLLLSKSRLNPVKKLTIPRLELMGILIGVRALDFVKKHLKMPDAKSVVFSDSTCALAWVKSGKSPDVFCKNRVAEISRSTGTDFRYVNTTDNPADWATRGKTVAELSDFWWHGPPWLSAAVGKWPEWGFEHFTVPCTVKEAKFSPLHEAGMVIGETLETPFEIDLEKFSSLKKLLRVTAWSTRFVNSLKKSRSNSQCLTAEEIAKAKILWIQWVQKQTYEPEMKALAAGKKHNLMTLGVFQDDEKLLRCKGRLANSELSWDSKFPILLPKQSCFVRLLVTDIHVRLGHVSSVQTFAFLRKEFWVPKGRSLVNQVVHSCVTCRKAVGRPFALPQMPELPKSRVVPGTSFKFTGVDYFGPLKVKSGDDVDKAWVCLFTCLTVRAVHLEVVTGLSAEQFLDAFRRFIARLGRPERMISDNGPQFKTVAEITNGFEVALSSEEVMNFCSNQGIAWTFIPAFAPYMGGVYERMVGLVKVCLRKTIGKALLTVQQLETVLCECEAIVNARPLTYVAANLDSSEILTPAHFLKLNPSIGLPEVRIRDDNCEACNPTGSDLIETWKKGRNLVEQFWQQWSQEYLNELRSKNTYLHKHNSRLPVSPAIGDLVLVKGNFTPRGSWRIAKIMKLVDSHDGVVRSVIVKLPSGNEVTRPLNLLIPFEFEDRSGGTDPRPESEDGQSSSTQNHRGQDNLPDGARQAVPSPNVVWAKVRGHPKWPAQVLDDISNTPLATLRCPKKAVPVKFFLTGNFAFVPPESVEKFEADRLPAVNNSRLTEAIALAERSATTSA